MFHSGSIHAVAGCEEFPYCFTLKRFDFAHLRLNLLKPFFWGGLPFLRR